MGLDQPDYFWYTQHVCFLKVDPFQIFKKYILILCSGVKAMDKRFWLLHHNYKNRHYEHQRSSDLGYRSPSGGETTISKTLCAYLVNLPKDCDKIL